MCTITMSDMHLLYQLMLPVKFGKQTGIHSNAGWQGLNVYILQGHGAECSAIKSRRSMNANWRRMKETGYHANTQ